MPFAIAAALGIPIIIAFAVLRERHTRKNWAPRDQISAASVAHGPWPMKTILEDNMRYDPRDESTKAIRIEVPQTTYRFMDMNLAQPTFRELEWRGIPIRKYPDIPEGYIHFVYPDGLEPRLVKWFEPWFST